MAGEQGFEPRQTESESVVLPLHNSPSDECYYTTYKSVCQHLKILKLWETPAASIVKDSFLWYNHRQPKNVSFLLFKTKRKPRNFRFSVMAGEQGFEP